MCYLKTRNIEYWQHNEMLRQMMLFCLNQNIFLFEQAVYRQKMGTAMGTAMGTCFAPSLANLFLGWWEEQVVWVDEMTMYTDHILVWVRYIDDLFIIWKGTSTMAREFINKLGANNLNLEFTNTISATYCEFLDVVLEIKDNAITTRLFRKKTAGNTVLHAASQHPAPLMNSIPYGELLRARRICNNETDYKKEKQIILSRFKDRGYKNKTLCEAQKKSLRYLIEMPSLSPQKLALSKCKCSRILCPE